MSKSGGILAKHYRVLIRAAIQKRFIHLRAKTNALRWMK